MSFLERLRHWLGPQERRKAGHGVGHGGAWSPEASDQALGSGLIEGEAADDAIGATHDPAEQEREEFGVEL